MPCVFGPTEAEEFDTATRLFCIACAELDGWLGCPSPFQDSASKLADFALSEFSKRLNTGKDTK